MLEISIQTLEYEIAPDRKVNFLYWVGALLRNNLLYAAASVPVDEEFSLLDMIQNTDDLQPRGYALQCDPIFEKTVLTSRESLHFRIRLFGRFAAYAAHFHAAVQAMCRRGIGHPPAPMHILSCRSYRNSEPVGLSGQSNALALTFITPVSIYNSRTLPQAKRTSLDMQNGMPGLYFTLRSLVRRINKLQVAYDGGTLWEDTQVEEWLRESRVAQLEECSLQRMVLEGPPRKKSERPIYFKGYVGHAVYSGLPDKYLPLLWVGMDTNVGNDTVYGLGQYSVSML